MLQYKVVPTKNPVNGQVLYHGRLLPVIPVDIETICRDISDQSTITVHDVKAVVSALEEQVMRFLQEGFSVSLGDLGTMHPSIRSNSALSPEDVSVASIKGVKVVYYPSARMKAYLSRENPMLRFQNYADLPLSPDPGNPDVPGSGGEQTI